MLATLYLPGYPGPSPAPAGARAVVGAVRACPAPEWREVADRLRRAGRRLEAFVLEDETRRRWAERAVMLGEALTVMDEAYPSPWRERLGAAAPPALWVRTRALGHRAEDGRAFAGTAGLIGGRWIGVVGSRSPDAADRRFAAAVAREASRLGFGVCSGAAPGTDRAAIRAAVRTEVGAGGDEDRTLEVLPCGVAVAAREGFPLSASVGLSLAAPDEAFSGPMAMRRNVLVYALGKATVVVRARFKAGGTWNGAIEAMRRRLGPILVRRDEDDLAHRALIALGGVPLDEPEQLGAALDAAPSQRSLFSSLG